MNGNTINKNITKTTRVLYVPRFVRHVNESNKYARSLENLKTPTKKFDLDAMLGL